MRKIPIQITEFEAAWKDDGFDIGWFVGMNTLDSYSEREARIYQRGLKDMLREIKTTFKHGDWIPSDEHAEPKKV